MKRAYSQFPPALWGNLRAGSPSHKVNGEEEKKKKEEEKDDDEEKEEEEQYKKE